MRLLAPAAVSEVFLSEFKYLTDKGNNHQDLVFNVDEMRLYWKKKNSQVKCLSPVKKGLPLILRLQKIGDIGSGWPGIRNI